MNDETPIPAALPVVVPSPVGPAISYSAIRATTSRAQTLLDQLGAKVKKHLQNGTNDAGQVGAKMESKILSRLADQLNPAEQLYNDTSDLIHNSLAASIAPAIVTLDDLKQVGAIAPGESLSESSAGVGTLPGGHRRQAEVIMPPQLATVRAGALARQLARSSGVAAGGAPVSPFAGKCSQITQAELSKIGGTILNEVLAAFNGNVPFDSNYGFNVTDDCLLYVEQVTPPVPLNPCGMEILEGTPNAAANQIIADIIIKNFATIGYKLAYVPPDVACPPGPVDCTKNPLDPSCPPDCVKHPEDPRCPPPTDHCPPPCAPPCIEVNVPPCPPCPPLQVPSCVQIDLCDWDKFCTKLTDCFKKGKSECALDNEVAYALSDCDGLLVSAQSNYMGQVADSLNSARTVTDAVMPTTVQMNQIVVVRSLGRDMSLSLPPLLV